MVAKIDYIQFQLRFFYFSSDFFANLRAKTFLSSFFSETIDLNVLFILLHTHLRHRVRQSLPHFLPFEPRLALFGPVALIIRGFDLLFKKRKILTLNCLIIHIMRLFSCVQFWKWNIFCVHPFFLASAHTLSAQPQRKRRRQKMASESVVLLIHAHAKAHLGFSEKIQDN